MDLAGRHVIVTGGAGGIGMATARRLLHAGCVVTLWDLEQESLQAARSALEGELAAGNGNRRPQARVRTGVVDITDRERVGELVEDAIRDVGGIDVLVNNAGHLAPGGFLDQDAGVWETTVNVNLTGVINATHAVLPHFYERGSGQIVNIASASSYVGVSDLSVYAATKWAVWGLTEALRHEAINRQARGVRFSSVHPNYIAHGMFGGARLRGLGGLIFPRLPDHDVVAKAIVEKAIRRGRLVVRRPRSLRLAILLRGILPEAVFNYVVRAMNVHTSMRSWTGDRKEVSRWQTS